MRNLLIISSLLLLGLNGFGQTTVQQESYYDVVVGVYTTKSTDKELIGLKPSVIQPQSKIINNDKSAFLNVEQKVIALFDRVNDLGTAKPIGVLTESSIIQVDTIFYKEIYKDTTQEWFLTFNVWYAITINGQIYYTDYKIHDFIAYRKNLDKYNQEFLLVAQSTGYDEYYDIGYPNYFFIVMLDENQEMIYNSEVLDFDYGDEFWDEELMNSVKTEFTDNGLVFTLSGVNDEYIGVWTGKELK
ncbi:MAG: hypothetical protein COB15_00915 [Flavobacteriales bacterium]|nr:MAG: hypothetical protein COB15_00915 [Flavobacteriales bacterium]